MKTTPFLVLFCIACSLGTLASNKPDSLGLPGDNFDLYGAMELFKNSNSPEAFEKAINSTDNQINNLDLNADGKVDYVKVIDKSKGDAHSLVLQVDVSKNETQDVAVVELEKTANGQAHVQIVGDEALYGKNYIVEPSTAQAAQSSPASGNGSSSSNNDADDDVYNNAPGNGGGYDSYAASGPPVTVNVWAWPSVQFMYGPAYIGWASPWYWGYYPGWWQPWTPMYWGYYHRNVYRYHFGYYHRTNFYSCRVAHTVYYGQRRTSAIVRSNNRSGVYAQRQAAYRSAGPPAGRGRYNSSPANPRNNVAGRQAAERNNNMGQQGGRSGMQNAGRQERQAQNANIQQSRQANRVEERANVQPRQMNAAPREYVTRPQAAPAQRSGGFPHGASTGGMGRGGGGGFGGGGGRGGGRR